MKDYVKYQYHYHVIIVIVHDLPNKKKNLEM